MDQEWLAALADRLGQLYTAVTRLYADVPAPFLAGLLSGFLAGVVLTSFVAGRGGLLGWLRRQARGLIVLVPAVLASLLWGVWIGILAAKNLLH